MAKLSKEAQELYDRYANSSPAPEPAPQFQLSQNGRARMQETLRSRGLDRESPEALMTATLRALAEQRGQPEANIGVNGRNGLGAGTRSERTGRSLSDMANGVGDE